MQVYRWTVKGKDVERYKFNKMKRVAGQDVLVNSLLGFEEVVGFKMARGAKILNDEWIVNLRDRIPRMDVLVYVYLKRFACGAMKV